MESEAIIARLDGQMAFVEVQKVAAGCGRCDEAGGCGSGLLSQALGGKRSLYRLPNLIGARLGDRVVLSVHEGAVLRASLSAYVVPVLLMIVGAAAGTALAASDVAADVAAMVGASLGLALALAALRLAQGRAFVHGEPLLSMRLKSPVINHSEDAFS